MKNQENSVAHDAKNAETMKSQKRKRDFFHFHRHARKSALGEGPDAREDALENADEADEREQVSRGDADSAHEKNRSRLRRIGKWLWGNRVAVSLAILVLAGVAALLVDFFAFHGGFNPDTPATICLTPTCVLAASSIIKNLSPKYQEIDPCENFNKYVCEGFMENHDLRADQGALFSSTLMSENAQQVLRHVVETSYSSKDQLFEMHSTAKEGIFVKLKDYYDACMDEKHIKSLGSAPLISTLKDIAKLFPIEESPSLAVVDPHTQDHLQAPLKSHDTNHLTQTVAHLTSLGITAFVDLDVGADDRDPDTVVTSVTAPMQPGLSSKEYYKDPKIVDKYAQTISEVLESLLEESKEMPTASELTARNVLANSAKMVQKLVAFESRLAGATPDTEDAEDVTKYYNPKSMAEVNELLPELSIPAIVTEFGPSGCEPSRLIVGSPKYLKTLSETLRNTSSEVIRTYLVWKTVQSYAYEVEDDAVKPLKKFNNQLQGKDPNAVEERWRTCIKNADRSLGWILSKFFVEEAFSAEAKDFGDRIVSEIKDQFVNRLTHAEWMSKGVRKLGIQKVHNIVQKIGYPISSPDIRNSSDLEQYYEGVNINKSSYYGNAVSVARFSVEREWSALCKPTDRAQWDMTADTVNAYYNPAGNEIVFPAGIMQAPVFFSPRVPQYLSYGAFGSVSGHELSHAFDSTGRHYDEIGNYTDWWDEDTVKAFTSKAQCFVDQYHDFTVSKPDGGSLHVNGKLTLGENIADAGGVNAAFAAWRQQETKNPGQLLPGLQHMTKEQLFFVSYATFWCGKIRPETAVNLIYRDPHSPAWARILGTMANSPDFLHAFNCPKKEPTCELW